MDSIPGKFSEADKEWEFLPCQISQISICGAWWREEGKISHCPFFSNSDGQEKSLVIDAFVPRDSHCLLHLPVHRKPLNSLTWDVWFSLFNNNLLTFPITCSLLQKLLYVLVPPLTSLEQFLRVICNDLSQAAVLILPQIKLTLQLSCCSFFFFKSTPALKEIVWIFVSLDYLWEWLWILGE